MPNGSDTFPSPQPSLESVVSAAVGRLKEAIAPDLERHEQRLVALEDDIKTTRLRLEQLGGLVAKLGATALQVPPPKPDDKETTNPERPAQRRNLQADNARGRSGAAPRARGR